MEEIKNEKIFFSIIIVWCLSQISTGQDYCPYKEVLITDFSSSNNIIIIDSKDSLYSKMGLPINTFYRESASIIDSISYENSKPILHFTDIEIEYIDYDGLKYICYNDSVQLIVIDFTKNNAVLYFEDICFSQNLDMDLLLQKCNYEYGGECVGISRDWYYGTYREMYQVSFISKIFPISGFLFYFDIDTKKLWYASFDFNKVGGIVR